MRVQSVAALLGMTAFLAGAPGLIAAQQTGQSLGDAARKAKEQQKQAPKAKVVWTNDNLPTSASVSVVGQLPQPESAAGASEGQAAEAASSAPDAETAASDLSKATAELADDQKTLDSAKTDLDLAQREYKLDSDQYYSTPNYGANQQAQAKLDADKNQVAAKQQAVDAIQKKVDELKKQVDSLNEKAKSAAPPSPKS